MWFSSGLRYFPKSWVTSWPAWGTQAAKIISQGMIWKLSHHTQVKSFVYSTSYPRAVKKTPVIDILGFSSLIAWKQSPMSLPCTATSSEDGVETSRPRALLSNWLASETQDAGMAAIHCQSFLSSSVKAHSSCGRLDMSKPINVLAWSGKDIMSPALSWGIMGDWWFLGEGQSVFLKDVTHGVSATIRWIAPLPELCGQHKIELLN